MCFQLNNVLIDIHFRIQIFNFLLKIVFLLSRFPFCYFRIKSFISVFESFIDLFRFKLQFSVWTFPLFPIQNFLFLISLFEIFLFICLHFISSFIYVYIILIIISVGLKILAISFSLFCFFLYWQLYDICTKDTIRRYHCHMVNR